MPGLSFLFKKGWHPLTLENQKKLYVAEQRVLDTKKREEDAAIEVSKEKEMQHYERLGELSERDPRTSSLRFMYNQPKNKHDNTDPNSNSINNGASLPKKEEEDEHVNSFYSKLSQYQNMKSSLSSCNSINQSHATSSQLPLPSSSSVPLTSSSSLSFSQSKLEDAVGLRPGKGLSTIEMEERHPFLKDAPTEGIYTKNVQLRYKPFNEVIRNVKCLRCGEWGHKSGDRECVLHNNNPHDWARQKQEDPLTFMTQGLMLDKQKLILRHGLETGKYGGEREREKEREMISSLQEDGEEEEESDPEAEFLSTLTTREKKLLLRRLHEMETGQRIAQSGCTSSSSSSSSSDSDSDNDNDSDSDSDNGNGKKYIEKRKQQEKRKKRHKSKSNKYSNDNDKKEKERNKHDIKKKKHKHEKKRKKRE
mmetsp:Transcript_8816/g.8889  ORF Transcript_8816/g.8889 Transcript_8816/m.8889 type:complete len:421 (-) Transcript_8816:35-1297(-)